ncbi:MAG TPA: class I SAM-dependent methyltransferase [Nitrospiria bacterium]|nr:class I SAM-dependent methyltransferase [Nitrospiria bacterium]
MRQVDARAVLGSAVTEAMGRCPLCGGTASRVIEQCGDVSTRLCEQCDVAYLAPAPAMSELSAHYDEAYYSAWMTSQQRARRRLWRQRLKLVRSRRSCGELLDVGCGDGSFLEAAQTAGYLCAGTELSEYAAEWVRRGLHIPVMTGPVRAIEWPVASFDIVTMWHVLEHLANPRGDLAIVYRLLRPGGLLFVAVPNRHSALFNAVYRLIKGVPPPFFMPDERELHLFHFTPGGLRRLLEGAGFAVVTTGMDVEDADWRKRWTDRAARWWFHLTGINRSMTILMIAEKPRD